MAETMFPADAPKQEKIKTPFAQMIARKSGLMDGLYYEILYYEPESKQTHILFTAVNVGAEQGCTEPLTELSKHGIGGIPMKILKPGKVEMRKFVCQECGCTFVAYEADAYDDYIKCPQGGCESIVSWKYEGEPYEEPTQDDRGRLDGLICDLFNREPISRECIVDYLIQQGVTFREE